MNWRWLVPAGTLAAVVIFSLWLGNRDPRPPTVAISDRIPDYELEDAEIDTMDESGRIRHRLSSPYIAQYIDSDLARLKTPTMWYYRPGRAPIRIDAEQGDVLQKGDIVYLHGKVKMTRPSDEEQSALTVETSEVVVRMKTKTAWTYKRAIAHGDRYTTTGVGASMDLDQGLYFVHSEAMTVYEKKP